MLETVLRTAVIYFFVIFAIRLMGKRQISDMQPSELVITILLSEIAAIPLQDTTQPLTNGIIAILMLAVLEIIMSVLILKSQRARSLLSGKPVIIIKNGVIDQSAMKKVRMTVFDLTELLRGKDVFDISSVAYAILEVNGELNVLLKSKFDCITIADMHLPSQKNRLPLTVISDGKISEESLKCLGLTKTHIYEILRQRSKKIDNIFLMTLDDSGKVTVIDKEVAK